MAQNARIPCAMRLRSPPMDALAGLLDGPRARGAFLLRSVMEPPWSVRVAGRGAAVARRRGPGRGLDRARRRRAPSASAPGDVAITRGPDPYTFADDPATPPQAIDPPRPALHDARRRRLHEAMDLGVRTWGNDPRRLDRAARRHLPARRRGRRAAARRPAAAGRRSRPRTLRLPRSSPCSPPRSSGTSRARRPCSTGCSTSLLVAALRAWFARPDAGGARPGTGPTATRSSGRRCGCCTTTRPTPGRSPRWPPRSGVSRAALARRFTELVGEPPMAFLTELAPRRSPPTCLREPGATSAPSPAQVGYGSPFALSTALQARPGGQPPRPPLAATG